MRRSPAWVRGHMIKIKNADTLIVLEIDFYLKIIEDNPIDI